MSDLIRREEAMRVIKDDWDASFSREDVERAEICKFHFIEISNIPTAEPKVGKWEQLHIYRVEDTTIDTLQSTYCPICHRYHTTPYIYSFNHYDYCPNCGAKMERSE